ncbi:MAG: protein kinase domain-containing protein [Pseudomarimonas sp.]
MAALTPEYSPDELAELLTAHMPDIPGYQVSRRLGSGGMSFVYLGVQESLNRQVAIKVISPIALKDEISKIRFEREARTIAKLQHPVIVDIYEVGRTELGLLYYVMPYLPRGNLSKRDMREDEPRLIAVLRALLWALEYAHEHGVVHRDVKPENVLFDNVDRPRLTDFGIAVFRSDGRRLTNGGFALGSATHMSPEQARGEKVDGRADLYSVGVLAFELLTGDLPFHAEDALSLAVRHTVDPIPLLPAGKAHWQTFINHAMAKTPDARFANAREMMSALDAIELSRQPAPHAATPGSSVRGLSARSLHTSPAFLSAGAVVVLLLAILVAYLAWSSQAPSPAASETIAASATLPVAPDTAPPTRLVPAPSTPAADSVAAKLPMAALIEGSEATSEGISEEVSDGTNELIESVDETLPPAEQALRRAEQQIHRRRLTQPPGDNALESLLKAQTMAADAPRLTSLGEAWLTTMLPYVQASLDAGGGSPDLRQLDSARQLVEALGLREGAAWLAVQTAIEGWLRARLRAALESRNLVELRAARATATAMDIPTTALEPEWSQGIVEAKVGDRLPGGIALDLLSLPANAQPGFAAMPGWVSRADYARFVAASGRSAARCKLRTKTFTLRARRWDNPGFVQQDDQPVVCVSLEDALAYARWSGERDGRRYRLAAAAEWRAHLTPAPAATGGVARCAGNPQTCAGQVREWSAPCGAGCTRQPAFGLSWRDAEEGRAAADAIVDPAYGYDDIGFRLVSEVTRAELEQR